MPPDIESNAPQSLISDVRECNKPTFAEPSSAVESTDVPVISNPAAQPASQIARNEQRNLGRGNGVLLKILVITISLMALSGIAAWQLIWRLSPDIRVFAGLFTVSVGLVVIGLVTLIFIIPAAGPDYDLKTEFYSVRAAYFCVLAGLASLVIVAFGTVLRGLHVFGAR